MHYGWVIVATGVAVVFGCLGLARFGFTMILPAMKEGLSLTEVQAGDLAVGNMVGYLALSLACGLLAARFGPRVVIGVSMLLVTASMVLTGLAPGYGPAFVGRLLAGIGSGGANVPIMALVSAWFGSKKRGLATGIIVSGSSVGLLVTGLLVPWVIEAHGAEGWRHAWFALAALSLLVTVLGWALLRDRPEQKALTPIGAEATPPLPAASALQWSLVYRSPAVWQLAVAYVMFGFSYVIYATFFARHLIGEVGFSAGRAGSLWSAIGALSLASGFLWGAVSDRLGRKYALAMVFLLQAACFAAFGLWRGVPGIYLSAVLFALTAWSIPAIMVVTAADILGPRLAPAAFGFITVFFGLGQVAGPFTAGRIAEACGSYGPAFTLAAAAAVAGSVFSLLLRRDAGLAAV